MRGNTSNSCSDVKWVDHLAAVIAHQNHKYIIDAGLKLYVWNTSIILIVVETHRKHMQDNSFVCLSTIFKNGKYFWQKNDFGLETQQIHSYCFLEQYWCP